MADKTILELLLGKGKELGKKAFPMLSPLDELQQAAQTIGTLLAYRPGVQGEGQRIMGELIQQGQPQKQQQIQQQGQQQKVELGPFEKGIQTAVLKAGKQAGEARVMEVGPEQASQEFEKIVKDKEQQQFQRQGNFLHRPMQVNQQTGEVHPEQILGGLIEAHPQTTATILENLIRGQKITGQEPLQKGEREALNTGFIFNVMQSSGQKQLSDTAVKTLEGARMGVEQTTELINQFEKDPNLFKGIGGPLDARSQQVKVIRNNLTDIIGRLRSGGAINEEEGKRFMEFVPKQGPLSGRTEAPETVAFKLKTLNKLFSNVVNGIQPASQASALVEKIQKALDNGYKPSDISKFIGF